MSTSEPGRSGRAGSSVGAEIVLATGAGAETGAGTTAVPPSAAWKKARCAARADAGSTARAAGLGAASGG